MPFPLFLFLRLPLSLPLWTTASPLLLLFSISFPTHVQHIPPCVCPKADAEGTSTRQTCPVHKTRRRMRQSESRSKSERRTRISRRRGRRGEGEGEEQRRLGALGSSFT
ncbi:hypothetical protein K438DRAFT_1871508, partial [Mycena galopus ATCC 62051]